VRGLSRGLATPTHPTRLRLVISGDWQGSYCGIVVPAGGSISAERELVLPLELPDEQGFDLDDLHASYSAGSIPADWFL
jgi:hypothetical protein